MAPVVKLWAELTRGCISAQCTVALPMALGVMQQRVRPQERAAVEAAMQDAFIAGTEEAWEQLLELTGAADQADGREGAPCINVQHRATGAEQERVLIV